MWIHGDGKQRGDSLSCADRRIVYRAVGGSVSHVSTGTYRHKHARGSLPWELHFMSSSNWYFAASLVSQRMLRHLPWDSLCVSGFAQIPSEVPGTVLTSRIM